MSRVRLSSRYAATLQAFAPLLKCARDDRVALTVWTTGEAKHESLMGDINMPIDYARAKAKSPALKAALTRANGKRCTPAFYPAVLAACKAAVKEWEQWGAWPDGWALWNVALQDAAYSHARATGEWPTITRLEQI